MIVTLQEDDNQGEADIMFFFSLITYTIYISSIDILYPDPDKLKMVGEFQLVMSNVNRSGANKVLIVLYISNVCSHPLIFKRGLWSRNTTIVVY